MSDAPPPDVASSTPHALALLDFCKGAAILGIIGVHVRPGWFGWQGVHVFLVLGGFLLAWSRLRRETPWRAWFQRRARRVLPAYWAVVLGGVVVVALVGALGLNLDGVSLRRSLARLPADVFLLRNWSQRGMFGYPNASLWYVPLLAGLYLVFPLLWRLARRASWQAMLAAAVAVELAYRAAAVAWLDGSPVGFGHGVVGAFGNPPSALDRLDSNVPFQLWAPFGLFLSRVGEFALGVAAAFAWADRLDARVLGWRPALVGLALWLAGGALVGVRWGWAAADLLIAAGGVLALLAVASSLRRWAGPVFRVVSRAGALSLPLFLVHLPVMYITAATASLWSGAVWSTVLAFALTLLALWGASVALLAFDRSRAADAVARVAIDPLLRTSPSPTP